MTIVTFKLANFEGGGRGGGEGEGEGGDGGGGEEEEERPKITKTYLAVEITSVPLLSLMRILSLRENLLLSSYCFS